MKQLTKHLTIVILLMTTTICAQTNKETENVLDAMVADLYAAMVDKNQGTLEKLCSETLSYGHSSGLIENKTEYIEAVINGSFDFISISPEDQAISVSGNTATVRHIFLAKGINDGNAVDVRIGALLVFQNQNGDWKLLARQAYKL